MIALETRYGFRIDIRVAFAPGGDDIIAAATLAADREGGTGEVAISILPDHKGKGIDWTLLNHVAQEARGWGIGRLQSIESRDNRAAIALERDMGFSARAVEGDPALVLLERVF